MSRFFSASLLILLLLTLTLKMKVYLGWSPSFLFAALLALAAILTFKETFVLAALAAWVTRAAEIPGAEVLLLFFLPLIVAMGLKFFPWQGWLSALLSTVAGVAALYALVPEAYSRYGEWIALDIFASALSALIVFWLFRGLYRTRQA